jgi:hypothetical protein
MADGFAPDEWDVPALGAHMPLPPPIAFVDLNAVDMVPFCLVGLESVLFRNAYHAASWWQPWFVWFGLVVAALWIINALIRPQNRRLFFWVPVIVGYFWLWGMSKLMWKPISVPRVDALSDAEIRRRGR